MKSVFKNESKINGVGIFAGTNFQKGELIGPSFFNYSGVWYNTKWYGDYNHSENPNCTIKSEFNIKFLMAKDDIQKGDELTADYTLQPEFEQPKKNWIK